MRLGPGGLSDSHIRTPFSAHFVVTGNRGPRFYRQSVTLNQCTNSKPAFSVRWAPLILGLARGLRCPRNCQEICDIDRQWGLIMNATSQVMVTLSADLLKQLRKEAREQHVPLRWLVASLVCDTLENGAAGAGCGATRVRGALRIPRPPSSTGNTVAASQLAGRSGEPWRLTKGAAWSGSADALLLD